LLPEISAKFSTLEAYQEPVQYGFNLNGFNIVGCWGAHYNKGEGLTKHNHFPYTFSFVYFVRTPQGSSIVIENEEMNLKEGQCVFFLSHQYHNVESNNCDDRCIIAGNILYER